MHEAGYNSDWIEKALAHEQRGVRTVYNKAEYAQQRSKLLQDWAVIWLMGGLVSINLSSLSKILFIEMNSVNL